MHSYEDMEEDWFRTLEKQDNKVLVHWWYYPDSYDSWLTQTAQFADPEDAPEHTGHWNLTCRWLQDAIKFNELMNEEDYEDVDPDYMNTVPQQQEDAEEEDLEEDDEDDEDDDEEDDDDDEMDTPSVASNHTQPSAAAPTPAVRLSIKRKASDSYADLQSTYDDDGGDPVHSMELPVLDPLAQPLVRVRDVEVEQPLLGSRQRKNEFEPYMNGDISNISQYTPQNMQLFPADPTETTDGKGLPPSCPFICSTRL
jgi:SWI/SNF related-matrix-associated actin-dependent regulator of chromatin subfamily C